MKKVVVRGSQISLVIETDLVLKKKDLGVRVWLPHPWVEVRELPEGFRTPRAPAAKGVARFLGTPFWVHETNLF